MENILITKDGDVKFIDYGLIFRELSYLGGTLDFSHPFKINAFH